MDEQIGFARFCMLVTVRQYSLEKLAESGKTENIKMRHQEYYREWLKSQETSHFPAKWLNVVRE